MAQNAKVIPFARSPGFLFRGLVPCFAGSKNGFQTKIVTLADWIILVVMTIRTADRQSQHRFAEGRHLVCSSSVLEQVGKLVERIRPLTQRPDRNGIFECLSLIRPKFVTSHLLHQKLIVRFVFVETSYDVISVTPGLFIEDIRFVTTRIGIPDNIEPMSCPSLAIRR